MTQILFPFQESREYLLCFRQYWALEFQGCLIVEVGVEKTFIGSVSHQEPRFVVWNCSPVAPITPVITEHNVMLLG